MKIKRGLNFALTFAAIAICMMSFIFEASAQKRRPTRRKTTAASVKTPPAGSMELKDGAQKVSTQIKNVSKFLYVLGGVAKDIEALDGDIKAGKIKNQTIVAQNNTAKQAVLQSIRNLQAGLAALEVEFRTKPALRNYLSQIDGVSGMTGTAEDQAAGGQLSESGKTLLLVVEKLTDTLAALP